MSLHVDLPPLAVVGQPDPTAPLVITRDPDLLADLLPLAAAADVTPAVVRGAAEALGLWGRAPVVLVGTDVAAELARMAPDPRPGVFLVGRARVPDEAFRHALAIGARQVVEVPVSDGWLVELLTDVTEGHRTRGRVVGVIGGAGGAGATTLACAVAQYAARYAAGPADESAVGGRAAAIGAETAIIDCDPQGPGLDRMLGLERTEGFRWDALCRTTGRLSARALREALPRRDQLGVLSWYAGAEPQRLQAFAVREALSAARRGHRTVVLDLPRAADTLAEELAARCDLLVLVAPATLVGVASTARLRSRFAAHPSVAVVVRGEELSARDVTRVVRLPVLAQMREQRGLAESIDLGLGPLRQARGPLARAAEAVWAAAHA
ncbi:septum site determining protein [Nocardioides sp. GY 10113]|uniref:septum site-determining protein Ssd n=1 Tax=Nocardioides sp. GY 10113 TaxID=2569761 RepID=UPI0010A7AD27|nr:septum site-determining protein Ssd [Nocardioides sp. GY 10113]TIC85091.1 septum site determining protein [Nocardioides sp. GY 10113]